MFSYLTAREQELGRRRAKVEKLLAWKQKLDAEEKEIERLEKEAVHSVASRQASSANDSTMSGELWHITELCTSIWTVGLGLSLVFERLEKEAVHGVTSRRSSSANDSTTSGGIMQHCAASTVRENVC